MSARMPGTLLNHEIDAMDVHEWLGRMDDDADFTSHGSSALAKVCESAVDPLEIAVALEIAGVSHAVATERYNRADVFSLARTLWVRIPSRPRPAAVAELPRAGNRSDLARGLLYAIPAVMLLALTSAFDLSLARWVLPLAISWGWGLGQVIAFVGYRMQVGAESKNEATVMARVIVASSIATLLLSTIAALVLGGGSTAVIAATGLVTYMVSSATLLLRGEERWLAILVMPGAVASVVVLTISEGSILSRLLVVVAVGGSFVAVVCRAFRQARLRKAGAHPFGGQSILVASGHLLHGIFCGLALSIVVIEVGHASPGNDFARMLLPVPLLATLGVMEWQLRTFRARVAQLTLSLPSALDFPRLARREFQRSCAICVATTAATAVAIMIAIRVRGEELALSSLIVECALAAVFFTDLIIVLLDRLDLVLRSWLAGVAVGGLTLVVLLVATRGAVDLVAFQAGCVLVVVVLGSLVLHARSVVSIAMNH
jgi:hypothetical protein